MTTDTQGQNNWLRQIILFVCLIIPGYIIATMQGITVGWVVDDLAAASGGALGLYLLGLIGRFFQRDANGKFLAQILATVILTIAVFVGLTAL